MLEVNAENLKLAYKKLKSYVYYYNSSNFLKKKIIEFEDWRTIDERDAKFRNIANSLLRDIEYLKENHDSLFKVEHRPSYIVYPKKNTASSEGDAINIDGFNLFIDLEIKFHLIDVLYALNLQEKFYSEINSCAYGNVIHKKALDYTPQGIKMLDNVLLFENHTYQYKKWKNCLIKAFEKENSKGEYEESLENVAIIKLDVEKCFYNIRFDFSTYDLGDGISSIMKNVYNYYKTIVSEKMGFDRPGTNKALLPIGLISSYVILNSIMSNVDEKILEKTIAYGRYVDDILMMVSVDELKLKKEDFLANLFPNVIDTIQSGELNLIVNESLKLKLNKDKTIVKLYKKLNRNDIQDETYDFISNSIDIDEIEDRRSNIFIEEKPMQRIGVELNRINDWDDLRKYCSEMNNQEIINSYPLWKSVFSKINDISPNDLEKENLKKQMNNRINQAIENVYLKLDDRFKDSISTLKENLIKVLKEELDVAQKMNFDPTYVAHHLSGITQEVKIRFIENKSGFVYAFPVRITHNEIMFYLGIKGYFDLDKGKREIFFAVVDGIYHILNDYSIYKTEKIESDKINYDKYKQVFMQMSLNDDLVRVGISNDKPTNNQNFIVKILKKLPEQKNIKIALVNFALPEISIKKEKAQEKQRAGGKLDSDERDALKISDMENYDILNQNSKEANPYVVKRLIKKAKKSGADYIVFPEFAIQFSDGMDVLNYCKKMHISLISGLTHQLDSSAHRAYNLTMIYDDRLGVCLCHYKRYLAPSEKEFLLYDDYIGVSFYRYPYFVIDDELLKYSSMTCYEATNISDRALFHNEVEAMFLPVYNYDTPYFSNIIESFSRDISAYIIQANANCYGDSRITAPLEVKNMDIVKLKGGINSYFVIGEINRNMKNVRGEYEKEIDDIYAKVGSKGFVEGVDKKNLDDKKREFKRAHKYDSNVFKSFSAGTNK